MEFNKHKLFKRKYFGHLFRDENGCCCFFLFAATQHRKKSFELNAVFFRDYGIFC